MSNPQVELHIAGMGVITAMLDAEERTPSVTPRTRSKHTA